MTRHALRAVPWGLVGAAGVGVAVGMELVRRHPTSLWALVGMCLGVLAAAAAWVMDEEAAAVVDTLPRGLAWRTVARLPVLVLLALGWAVVCVRAGADGLLGRSVEVLVQGWAALALGAGLAVGWRRRGAAVPGPAIASSVVPLATGWALVRPLGDLIWVLPGAADPAEVWRASTTGWVVAAVLVAVVAGLPRRHPASSSPREGFLR